MGYMNEVSIESQNIFEGKIFCLMDNIEVSIQDLIDSNEKSIIVQEGIIDAIERLYHIYQIIQIDLWERWTDERKIYIKAWSRKRR